MKISLGSSCRVAKKADLLEGDHLKIPGGTGVGYEKLDFGTKIANIPETEQHKDLAY